MKFAHLLIALCCLSTGALAATDSVPSSYALENTEVRDIHAKAYLGKH